MKITLENPQRFVLAQSVPTCSVTAHGAIAVAPDVKHNSADCRFDLCQIGHAAPGQRRHQTSLLNALENAQNVAVHFLAHHITTLFSGYSTMPCAFSCLSFGISVHAVFSSITVLTATQSPSARGATVGFFSAVSKPRTAGKSALCTLSIRPTRPSAAIAPLSMTARFSIFCRRAASAQAALFAISCVFDSEVFRGLANDLRAVNSPSPLPRQSHPLVTGA